MKKPEDAGSPEAQPTLASSGILHSLGVGPSDVDQARFLRRRRIHRSAELDEVDADTNNYSASGKSADESTIKQRLLSSPVVSRLQAL